MKRIIFVTDAWKPQVNGLITVFNNLLPALEKRGYEVKVIEPSQFSTIPLPKYSEIRLSLLPKKKIQRILADYKPDAVHIFTEGPLGVVASRVCCAQGLPFTTSYHTNLQLYFGAYAGRMFTAPMQIFLRWFHSRAVRTLVATPGLKAELESYGYTHVALWPFGVDMHLFVRSTESPVMELKKPIFVYLGRIAREKSIEDFLSLDLPGSKLLIGDGPDKVMLEKKYPAAHFVGYKFGTQLVQYLSLGDVCAFPSRTETFGLAIIEALACGLPIAAYDVMGPRDIVTTGKDGYLGEDIRDSALKCLELSPSDCREKAELYSWERSTDAFLSNLEWITVQ